MKKIFILLFMLSTCTYIGDAQKRKPKTYADKLEQAWAELKVSRDSSRILITDIKQLAQQKIIYRTKLVEHRDTTWRIDTCISVITRLDSLKIALMFNQPVPKETKSGKRIFFFFRKKNK